MGIFSKQPTIVAHDGRFHADDIFACATLQILLDNKGKIIRTRDMDVINKADYVVDVGGEHDPAKKRFDHHQKGGAGTRPNGIPYASFGLVWKEYGAKVCGSQKIADRIEAKLVLPIDAWDNAVDTCTKIEGRPMPYFIQSTFSAFFPTWKEGGSEAIYDAFIKLVDFAQKIIEREIIVSRVYMEAEEKIDALYATSEDKRYVVLDDRYPWEEATIRHSELLYVVAPRADKKWKIEGIFKNLGSFDRRAYCPASWAGLRDGDLAKVTGVPDAVFCHNGRFIAVAESKEGALALVRLALEQK